MRRIIYRVLVCQFAMLAIVAHETKAQATVCLALAQSLRPDVLIQGSSFQQFSQLQQLVANSTFQTWGNASSSGLSLGIDIPGEVDAILGTSSNASNWGSNRAQFLSMNAQQAFANGANSLTISQMSVSAVKIIADCAKETAARSGFSATLQTVSDNRDSFAVLLTNGTIGTPGWKLTQFSVQPDDSHFKCAGDYQNASSAHPIQMTTQTQIINCSKDPAKSLTLAIQTSAGAAQTFTMTSVHEEIQALRDETTAAIQGLATKLDKHGFVVAFAASTCPAPWVVYQPAQGRFIRGLDPSGTVDPDGALRVVGSLQSDGIANHTHTMGVNGTDTTTMTPGVQRLAHFNSDPRYGAGPKKETDANTNGISETRPKNVALLYCTLP